MDVTDFKHQMEVEGYSYVRQLSNGEWIGIWKFLFTWGLVIGISETGYRLRYCYEKQKDVIRAVLSYEVDCDPIGPWIKRKGLEGGERLGPGAKGMADIE